MKTLNRLIKFFGYAGVYLFTLFRCYLLSLITSGAIFSLICATWSFVSKLPALISEKFWLIYLLSCVPFAIIFFVIIVTDVNNKTELKPGFKRAI